MPILEFKCTKCQILFEEIVTTQQKENGELGFCPQCQSNDATNRTISAFALKGRGDQRESTSFGCSGCANHSHPRSSHK